MVGASASAWSLVRVAELRSGVPKGLEGFGVAVAPVTPTKWQLHRLNLHAHGDCGTTSEQAGDAHMSAAG